MGRETVAAQGQRAQIEDGRCAVGNDVQRVDAAAPGEDRRDLLQAVLAGIDDMHL